MKIAVIGAGAAGFFSAITAKENFPDAEVSIYEKSKKILAKVRISGGGRCNVTNGCTSISQLASGYPRGSKELKKAFRTFNNSHIISWFEERGVQLKTENDNRVFPVSDNSQSIIDCLNNEVFKLKINLFKEYNLKTINPSGNKLNLHFDIGGIQEFDKVIIATGGSPKKEGLKWLQELGHKINEPVPSLFTFNMPSESITDLMGVTVENTIVSIEGTKLKSEGPLLITHWGLSGPAILKLSSIGARLLNEKNYKFNVHVNWVNEVNHEKVQSDLAHLSLNNPNKFLANLKPFNLPERLWLYLLKRSTLNEQKIWTELGKKGMNKLVSILTNDSYSINGKTTFKDEFVTCGGISLESVDFNTMESKACKNLYFAGEVLDIDGITGGYNFQAAWTTGYIAGQLK